MKTTFLVRDGLCQVVLHPESKAERAVLDLVSSGLSVDVHRGQFAETQAGYVRQFGLGGHPVVGSDYRPDLVLVLRPAKSAEVPAPPEAQTRVETRVECFTPPDDVNTYFRKTQDGTWQTYHRQSRLWYHDVGAPPHSGPDRTYEVEQLKAELRDVRRKLRDAVRTAVNSPATQHALSQLCSSVESASTVCDNALGGEKHDHVGGGHD